MKHTRNQRHYNRNLIMFGVGPFSSDPSLYLKLKQESERLRAELQHVDVRIQPLRDNDKLRYMEEYLKFIYHYPDVACARSEFSSNKELIGFVMKRIFENLDTLEDNTNRNVHAGVSSRI